mmetsp:Transcript_21090/g.43107  ORF Transcript_21090/g.43107 Transcript_21090/m.43107 type:complete len:107 (+) Transcript_21090:670-990(+)
MDSSLIFNATTSGFSPNSLQSSFEAVRLVFNDDEDDEEEDDEDDEEDIGSDTIAVAADRYGRRGCEREVGYRYIRCFVCCCRRVVRRRPSNQLLQAAAPELLLHAA